MQIFYGINKIEKYPRPIVALGVFDGLHRGHQVILQSAVNQAKSVKGTSLVVTFWPHPQHEEILYSLEHRLWLINNIGIDVCVVISFTDAFARVSAYDFIKNVLVKKLAVRCIYVGDNFRFGKNAEGDLRILQKAGQKYNFHVKGVGIIKVNGQPISSSRIRRLIKEGKFIKAQALLGRPVSIFGTIVKGISLSAKLGYPTANINVHHEVIPPQGVYAVRVFLEDKLYIRGHKTALSRVLMKDGRLVFRSMKPWALARGASFNGACYIGPPPKFSTPNSQLPTPKYNSRVEVHIFNFYRNIYGQQIEVQFIRKIRDRKKFTSPEDLIAQIKKDITASKKILSPY